MAKFNKWPFLKGAAGPEIGRFLPISHFRALGFSGLVGSMTEFAKGPFSGTPAISEAPEVKIARFSGLQHGFYVMYVHTSTFLLFNMQFRPQSGIFVHDFLIYPLLARFSSPARHFQKQPK